MAGEEIHLGKPYIKTNLDQEFFLKGWVERILVLSHLTLVHAEWGKCTPAADTVVLTYMELYFDMFPHFLPLQPQLSLYFGAFYLIDH